MDDRTDGARSRHERADTGAALPEETGESPLAWLTTQRLALARDLLETTKLSMEHIADRAGMGTATNLRLHFTSSLGIPPNLYRKQFRRAEA